MLLMPGSKARPPQRGGASTTSAASAASPQGRLTLTSATPVTVADVVSQTTLYYSPYNGGYIPIYDGTFFTMTAFVELSQLTTDAIKSPAAVAASKVYDIFGWNDAGTMRATRGPAWTNDTTRGYTLTMVNGVLLNTSAITNGAAALRGTYLGTVRSDAASQLNDSAALRHVWNTYNRVARKMRVIDTTDSWNYTLAVLRQARASAANQLDFVRGLDEDQVTATVLTAASNASATVVAVAPIGLDSTTTMSPDCIDATIQFQAANLLMPLSATYTGYPGIGRHTLVWLEYSGAAGTTTWYGDSGNPAQIQGGIQGSIQA